METEIKAACFDMDGTLILNTNSVKYLCYINGKKKEVDNIEKMEEMRSISWIEADYLKGELIRGLNIQKVSEEFDSNIQLIKGIDFVIKFFQAMGIKTALITAGPIEVAEVLGKRFNFDEVYGSVYEVVNGKYTGKIKTHLGDRGKRNCLEHFCETNGISPGNCIAIGDSSSDVEVFKICRKSIAINYSEALLGKADEYIKTDDLEDILELIGIEKETSSYFI